MKALIAGAATILLLTGCASNSNKLAVDASQYTSMECNQLSEEKSIHVNKVDSLLKEQADYITGETASVVLFGRMSGVNSESKPKQEVEMNKIYAIESEMDNKSCSYTKWIRKYNLPDNSPTM